MSVSEPDPQVDPELEALRAEAEALGLKVNPRAKADTIRRKIREQQADVEQPEPEPEPEVTETPEPEVHATVSDYSAGMRAAATASRRMGARTRSWVDQRGRRKTTRTGSELDRWYESAEHWKPA